MSVPRGPSLTCRERLGEAHGDFSVERSRPEERAGRRVLPRAGRSASPPGPAAVAPAAPLQKEGAPRRREWASLLPGPRREAREQRATTRRAGARAVVREQNPESHQPKPVAQPGSATRVEGWLLLPPLPPFCAKGCPRGCRGKAKGVLTGQWLGL